MSTASPSWSVYILRCADGSLYTGATNDPARRLAEHAAGAAARYTRSRLPVRLVYQEAVRDRSSALRREAALKRLPRAQKLALVERGPTRGAPPKPRPKLSVRPVYRAIVKKGERQAGGIFDVLVCGHAVPAYVENTYRKASACPECRLRVQQYVDERAAGSRR